MYVVYWGRLCNAPFRPPREIPPGVMKRKFRCFSLARISLQAVSTLRASDASASMKWKRPLGFVCCSSDRKGVARAWLRPMIYAVGLSACRASWRRVLWPMPLVPPTNRAVMLGIARRLALDACTVFKDTILFGIVEKKSLGWMRGKVCLIYR